MNRASTKAIRLSVAAAQGFLLARCGLTLGGGGSTLFPNDTVPSGTVVAQGTISGQNGKSASGTASLYADGASYTLRLAGLSAPAEGGLQAQVFINNSAAPACSITLTYYTGNKNYPCSTSGGVFTSVNLFSVIRQYNYGTALLQAAGK